MSSTLAGILFWFGLWLAFVLWSCYTDPSRKKKPPRQSVAEEFVDRLDQNAPRD